MNFIFNNFVKDLLIDKDLDIAYLEEIMKLLVDYGLFLDTINIFDKVIDKIKAEILKSKGY